MKNLTYEVAINTVKKLFDKIVHELIFITPFMVFLGTGTIYILQTFFNKQSYDVLNITIAAIALSATISGLSFSASNSNENKSAKLIFYTAGERLFHATILFTVSLVAKYAFDPHGFVIIQLVEIYVGIFFFYIGLFHSTLALALLNRAMWKNPDKVTDDLNTKIASLSK